jgi:hypothetical protein
MHHVLRGFLAVLLTCALLPRAAAADDVKAQLARIKALGSEGKGNDDAAPAWKALVAHGTEALLPTLQALDDAGVVGLNWLRPAVDAIVEQALSAKKPLPVAELEKFLRDTKNGPQARRVAYELLVRVDPKTPERFLPDMLGDPSSELRRDAVARVIKEADELFKKEDKPAATAAYRKALSGACDPEQVEDIAKKLKLLKVEVDLPRHYGFLQTWHIAGLFDNTGLAGFKQPFDPEKKIDLNATCKGKGDMEVRWKEHTTKNPQGLVALTDLFDPEKKLIAKESVAYALAQVDSPKEQAVQVRVGCLTAVKVFLNGKQIFYREEYHHGMRADQYIIPATLKAGRNELLLKVCQNDQKQQWEKEWPFQVRLTDSTGNAAPFTQPAPKSDVTPKEKQK